MPRIYFDFDLPSKVDGPTGPRHPMDFYDRTAKRLEQFGRITPEETTHLLECYFQMICLLAGNDTDHVDRWFKAIIRDQNEILATRVKRGSIPPRVRFAVLKRSEFRCEYCGAEAPGTRLEIDHVVPISRGGSNEPGNLVAACWECNRGKGDGDFDIAEDEP